MSNYSDFLIDYYNGLYSRLLEEGVVSPTASGGGNQTITPSISGTITGAVTDDITILNHDVDAFYIVDGDGTSTISGNTIYWRSPVTVGNYSTTIYAVKYGEILSSGAQYNRTVTNDLSAWSGNTITVGPSPGRDYTSINEAISAASTGDMILIDPFTYTEQVVVNKHIHLRGNVLTMNDSEYVYITIGNHCISYTITDSTAFYNNNKVFYIEGLRVDPSVSWKGCFFFDGFTANNATVKINKCNLGRDASNYCVFGWRYTTSGSTLSINNCYMFKSYAHVNNMQDPFSITKCESDESYYAYQSTSTPDPLELVITPTSGYGYNYGIWNLPLD